MTKGRMPTLLTHPFIFRENLRSQRIKGVTQDYMFATQNQAL